jgi:hypothetical protein
MPAERRNNVAAAPRSGLPWSAVNLDRGELDTGWQLQRVRRQLLHQETKTEASEGTLPMPGICVTALRIREKDQAAAKAAAGVSWVQSGLVFTTRAGTPFEPRNLNRRFETRCVSDAKTLKALKRLGRQLGS